MPEKPKPIDLTTPDQADWLRQNRGKPEPDAYDPRKPAPEGQRKEPPSPGA